MSNEARRDTFDLWGDPYAGMAGPEQTVAELANDVLRDIGEQPSHIHPDVLDARWEDEATNQKLRLERLGRDGLHIYRLRVYDFAQHDPSLLLRYTPTQGGGANLCDQNWRVVRGPSPNLETTMADHLRTAPNVAFRHGSPDPQLDRDFWKLAAEYALSHKQIEKMTLELGRAYDDAPSSAQFEKIISAIRTLSLNISEELMYYSLEKRLQELGQAAKAESPQPDTDAA